MRSRKTGTCFSSSNVARLACLGLLGLLAGACAEQELTNDDLLPQGPGGVGGGGTAGAAGSAGNGGAAGTAGSGAGGSGATAGSGASGAMGGAGGTGGASGAAGAGAAGGVGGVAGAAGVSGSGGAAGTGGVGGTAGGTGGSAGGVGGTGGVGGVGGTGGVAGTGGTGGDVCTDPGSSTGPAGVFFSEYVEDAQKKAVEIYNAGPAITRSTCKLLIYPNGQTSPNSSITLTGGTFETGATFVMCLNSSVSPACNQSSGSITYNGNDAIALECGGAIVDVIGTIGPPAPARSWQGCGLKTEDQTLLRKCGITSGNPAGFANPGVEWTSPPGGPSLDLTNLGSYHCP
ncbi:MAG: hypothetical protein KIT72_18320 [Polyangiaceae bacterium]|nr:hypothetical protein [Polyangiaceae bacterium]MCW5792373.1 hypothetical protein [Polyangiaceae bacterium]